MSLAKNNQRLVLLASLLTSFSCDARRSIQLPDKELIGLAFFAFSEAEQTVLLSPLQPAQNLKSGNHQLTEDESQYSVEMFVFNQDIALEEARLACLNVQSPESRFVCLRALDNCENIGPCLSVEVASTACKDRVVLDPSILEIRRFREDNNFLIEDNAEIDSHINDLFFCGPKTKAECPFRIPGYIITQSGSFHCIAPGQQLSCTLALDLNDCGLDTVSAEISNSGEVTATIDAQSSCSIEKPTSADHSELGPADFAIVCDRKRYAATYADTLLATAQCPHLGPTYFDSDLDIGGSLNALYPLNGPDNLETLLLVGKGDNSCASWGCFCESQDRGCVECCHDRCSGNILARCVQRDELSTCSEPPKDSCINECLEYCGNPVTCSSSSREGMAVVSMAPDRPYVTESIVNLDPPNTYGRLASGNQPLRIVSSDASKYTIATIENTGMMFAELQAGRELTQKNPRINFDFEAVNLLSWQNKFFVIGHTRSATASTGMIAQIQFSNLTDPSSDFDVQTRSLDFLSRVDFATSNESHLYLASRATDSAAPNTTIYALNAALELEHTYSVSGQVTALAALEQDHLVASTYNPDLDQDSIYTFATSVAGDVGNNTRAIKGLRIRNLLPQAARSRIFVGYEIVAGLIAEQTGAIGVLEISGNGEMELRAPFVSTKGGPVNFLSLSVDEKTLYSVASYSNWIHSFVLYE